MSIEKKFRDPRNRSTNIIVDQEIETPYPYCPLPRNIKADIKERGPVAVEKLRFREDSPQLRSILTVSTWEGRTIMDLRSVD